MWLLASLTTIVFTTAPVFVLYPFTLPAVVADAARPVQEAELPPALPVMLPVIVLTTVRPSKFLVLAGSV